MQAQRYCAPAITPPPPKESSRKGDTLGKGSGMGSGKSVVPRVSIDVVPVGNPSRDSPRTAPISVYRKVFHESDLVVHERDAARVAARAVPLVEQEVATVKGKLQKF